MMMMIMGKVCSLEGIIPAQIENGKGEPTATRRRNQVRMLKDIFKGVLVRSLLVLSGWADLAHSYISTAKD